MFICDHGLFWVVFLLQWIAEDTCCTKGVCIADATSACKQRLRCRQLCLLLYAPLWINTTPPPFFFFLFKDPRGHQSHRYHHHHMNSQSLESLQHTQNDLMSPQQVWATNGKRKQSTFQWQDLQVRIKCLKNSQYADQLCCICFSVLIVSFILCCFQTLYSSEESVDVPAQPVSVLNSKMSAECCRAASV